MKKYILAIILLGLVSDPFGVSAEQVGDHLVYERITFQSPEQMFVAYIEEVWRGRDFGARHMQWTNPMRDPLQTTIWQREGAWQKKLGSDDWLFFKKPEDWRDGYLPILPGGLDTQTASRLEFGGEKEFFQQFGKRETKTEVFLGLECEKHLFTEGPIQLTLYVSKQTGSPVYLHILASGRESAVYYRVYEKDTPVPKDVFERPG